MSADAAQLAVVTGALGNLGPVWCDALASAGFDVVRIDIVGDDSVDVTDGDALRAVLDNVGTPHVLVNNAGIDQAPDPNATGGMSADEFLRVLDVNTRGVFVSTQVFGSAMAEAGRGSIVNIGSLYASIAPIPELYEHIPGFVKPPAYGASKAGVIALTKYFARLWGPRGVRVNALSPGGVRGEQDAEFVRKYSARVPLGRMAEPSDLTRPLLFLASDASRYVTGHELLVDGGFSA
ncbi:MAG TPA: SDR family oxidoreductase [Gaiellaceae bacterium]|jgi:NAD(P)-dependent dehydrogenase (short-subunit alcohol dehydrogenase family)